MTSVPQMFLADDCFLPHLVWEGTLPGRVWWFGWEVLRKIYTTMIVSTIAIGAVCHQGTWRFTDMRKPASTAILASPNSIEKHARIMNKWTLITISTSIWAAVKLAFSHQLTHVV